MLTFFKNLFSKNTSAPSSEYAFFPLYRSRLQMGQVELGPGMIGFGAVGSAPWFNPRSSADRNLLLGSPSAVLETDSLPVLQDLSSPEVRKYANYVLYQPWREPNEKGVRRLGAMTEGMAEPIGQALKGSPARNLILISGGFTSGSLAKLEESLGGHELETLGLFWYFSGDDITDDLGLLKEIVSLCKASKVKNLSLLTAETSATVDSRLAQGLGACPSLEQCRIFEKDDHARYRQFSTPKIDAAINSRVSGASS